MTYQQARVAMIDDHFEWRWQAAAGRVAGGGEASRAAGRCFIRAKINLEAEALVATLASRLGDGLCFIDYGFPRREYYPRRAPQRHAGVPLSAAGAF